MPMQVIGRHALGTQWVRAQRRYKKKAGQCYVGVDADVDSVCGDADPSDPDLSAPAEVLMGAGKPDAEADGGSPPRRCHESGDSWAEAPTGVWSASPGPLPGASGLGLPMPSWREGACGVAGVLVSLLCTEEPGPKLAPCAALIPRLGLEWLLPLCLLDVWPKIVESALELLLCPGLIFRDAPEAIATALSLTKACWTASSSLRSRSTSNSRSERYCSSTGTGRDSSSDSSLSLSFLEASCLAPSTSFLNSLTCRCNESRSRLCFCNKSENSAVTTSPPPDASSSSVRICARMPSNSASALECAQDHACSL
mmetsp:Transcript_26316/g.35496  ORF Transcript_26316/g.35496 Transcript_26316/m.35496 type:complete len:311 (-) Transcript_26316:140-1072(-)